MLRAVNRREAQAGVAVAFDDVVGAAVVDDAARDGFREDVAPPRVVREPGLEERRGRLHARHSKLRGSDRLEVLAVARGRRERRRRLAVRDRARESRADVVRWDDARDLVDRGEDLLRLGAVRARFLFRACERVFEVLERLLDAIALRRDGRRDG
eukprot:31065-Pelagococcus_subviridis.AAC.8